MFVGFFLYSLKTGKNIKKILTNELDCDKIISNQEREEERMLKTTLLRNRKYNTTTYNFFCNESVNVFIGSSKRNIF